MTLFGGNITLFTELWEKTRADAFEMMVELYFAKHLMKRRSAATLVP